ncbi:putative flavonoid 3',5'-hydroxylase [Helianthus debilis subsp. tardiflorus]
MTQLKALVVVRCLNHIRCTFSLTKLLSCEGLNISDFFPALARFDFQGVKRKMDDQMKQFDRIFETTIEERTLQNKRVSLTDKTEEQIKQEGKKDFLQILLELKDQKTGPSITMTQLKALVVGGKGRMVQKHFQITVQTPNFLTTLHERFLQQRFFNNDSSSTTLDSQRFFISVTLDSSSIDSQRFLHSLLYCSRFLMDSSPQLPQNTPIKHHETPILPRRSPIKRLSTDPVSSESTLRVSEVEEQVWKPKTKKKAKRAPKTGDAIKTINVFASQKLLDEDNKKKKQKQTKQVEPIVTKIPKKKIQKSSKKYHPFTNQKANLRCSPGNLTEFLEGLTPAQKKVVKEMGFGDILFINIHTIPTGFAYWLVQNYDPNTQKIFDGTH